MRAEKKGGLAYGALEALGGAEHLSGLWGNRVRNSGWVVSLLLGWHYFLFMAMWLLLADQKCKSRNKGLVGCVSTWFWWKGSLKTTATSLRLADANCYV